MDDIKAQDYKPAENKPAEPVFKVFKLRKPIQAHGETMKELRLREPTARDITKAGFPLTMTQTGVTGLQMVFEEQKMALMMSELAVIPPSSVAQLDPRDWSTVATWLASFFVPDWDQVVD